MNIIFLDFDGVMDTACYDMYLVSAGLAECDEDGRPVFDLMCISELKRIFDITKAYIVVTSDWKYTDGYDELLEMWKDRNMPGFLIDTTPNISPHRGNEIEQWLKECKIDCNYVIIDDLSAENFNSSQIDKLVVVDPFCGLDELAADKAIEILLRHLLKYLF